ncbi:MAG: hypothetical protein V3W18_00700 [candidate division Zixibacteria bacterium]
MAVKIKQKMLKDREKLIEMYHQERMSLTDIARKYGCSRQYVQLIFITLGIERRERREALNISPRRRKSKFNFGPIQDNFIAKNYKRMTDREIARHLNKPAPAVTYRRLMVLGKKKIERRNFTSEEDQFILNNYQRLTDQVMARVLDRSLISVTHHRSRILNRAKRLINGGSVENDPASNLELQSAESDQVISVADPRESPLSSDSGGTLGLNDSTEDQGDSIDNSN